MRSYSQVFRSWTVLRLTLALAAGTSTACSPKTSDKPSQASRPLVTDVSHSLVKNQSIGNCWLYAAAGWAESLHLSATGEEVDLSESYWTWWHFYEQIVGNPSLAELQTGGWWTTANGLIEEHGYLLEGEFIAEESGVIRSERQKAATAFINEQLKAGGALATAESRTDANVRAQLDLAFGTDMATAAAGAHPAAEFVVGTKPDGSSISLVEATQAWQQVGYPAIYGQGVATDPWTQLSRTAILKRVMKALNDRQPVVMTLMVDFNAWDKPTGTFNLETLASATEPGRQGGHMLILEDYAVDDVPGVGSIEEGDVSDEMKVKALEGKLRHFVVKNSWSASVTDGYHRFTRSYLDAQLAWKNPSGTFDYYTTLSAFVLPPGY